MQCSFEHKESILDAGNSTVFLNVEEHLPDGSTQFINGTAFFVSEQLLITAGHNVVSEQGSIGKIRITYGGLKKVRLSKCATIECNIVDILYDPTDISKDIAILECPTLLSPSSLRISADILTVDTTVHIIGYPGEIKDTWLREAHSQLNDYRASMIASKILLPEMTLTATEGTIEEVYAGRALYKLSTSKGMSGGCLLYEGKAYGIVLFR
jgi:Trypsin